MLSGKPKAWKRHELDRPTRIVLFRVSGRAVPWSVPEVKSVPGKSPGARINITKKAPALAAWQEWVGYHARQAYGPGRPLYKGPVGVSFWFYIRPPDGRLLVTPDVTNMAKAFEDALQGNVITNDTQVFSTHPERIIVAPDDEERAWAEVWAVPSGPVEPEDPGPYAYRPWQWCDDVPGLSVEAENGYIHDSGAIHDVE